MTKTSTAAAPTYTLSYDEIHRVAGTDLYGQVVLRFLDTERTDVRAAYLELIEQSKSELESIEAGFHGQTGEQRAVQNRAWNGQNAAQVEIVKAALAAGVPSDAITAITYRNVWDMAAA